MNDFKGRHFTGEVILWAVRWYCRYGISYRDLEEMLSERGIDVDHTTIYRWVQCYNVHSLHGGCRYIENIRRFLSNHFLHGSAARRKGD